MTEPTTDSDRTRNIGSDWSLGHAWRLRALWSPVAQVLEAAAVGITVPIRVLAIGDRSDALDAMLARLVGKGIRFDVRPFEPNGEPVLPFEAGAFEWAVAGDWLPNVRPSQRERAVSELCRVSRAGVVLSNPFHSPDIEAAERAVNTLHVATTGGGDHPDLGRHIEYGLPDLEAARSWVRSAFPNVDALPGEPLASWQSLASTSAFASLERPATAADAAAAALLPPASRSSDEPSYRTVLVAAARPVALPPPAGGVNELTALATQLAMETAAQRGSLDRLVDAVTKTRDRERDEFKSTVASLAAELHEREAQAEVMGASLREHSRVIADQTAIIEAMEKRIDDTDLHVRNLEDEREKTRVHVRNVEAERELARAQAVESARSTESARQRVADLERELEQARQHATNIEAAMQQAAEAHRRLLDSPSGRAFQSYVRAKQTLMGKDPT